MDIYGNDSRVKDIYNNNTWKRIKFKYGDDIKFPEEEHITEIINISEEELFNNLELSVLSVSGMVENVSFSEVVLTDTLSADEDVFLIKSDYGGCYYPDAEGYAKDIWDNKIMAKVNKKQLDIQEKIKRGTKARKLRGDGSSLSSQIGFYVKTSVMGVVDTHQSKHIYISVFTNGVINIMGTKSIETAYRCVQLICNKLQVVLQTNPYIDRLFPTMYKYKLYVNYPLCIPLTKLYDQLKLEKTIIDKNPDITPSVIIKTIDYDQEKDPAKLTIALQVRGLDIPYPPTKTKKELNVSVKCFQGNKINIDGYAPEDAANFIYIWLRMVYYKILVTDVKTKYSDKYDFESGSGSGSGSESESEYESESDDN